MSRCTAASPRRGTLRLLLLPWIAQLGGGARPAWAQSDAAAVERRVKAAFLFKFVAYVGWPEGSFAHADAPLVIGVMGDDLLLAELSEVVVNRTMDGRPLQVKKLRETDSLMGLHMLFVARSENARLAALVRASSNQPLLVVSEVDGALDQGSMINFVVVAGHVKFDIAPETAEKRGVKLSSRLLTVAQRIRIGTAR